MKILYIVPFVPWEIKVRSFNLIPRLSREHEISLVCVSTLPPNASQDAWIRKYCAEFVYVPLNKIGAALRCASALFSSTPVRIAYCDLNAAKAKIANLYERVHPNVVYVERWRALQLVPPSALNKTLCDPTDSMTLHNRRLLERGAWWERMIAWEEYRKFRTFEGKLARQPALNVFCSELDLDVVRKQAPDASYGIVPNGVDGTSLYFKKAEDSEPATILFTGSLRYGPNRHAVDFFMDKIFPIVRREIPSAKFMVVGNGASIVLSKYLKSEGFQAIDFVPDLRPYLERATVAVAPLTIASGVSNKLAEGFAVGTPVVATKVACGDLPVTDGDQLFIADSPEVFARRVVQLINDSTLRIAMTQKARKLVDEQFDWEIVFRKMEELLEQVAAKSRNSKEVAVLPA